MSKCGCPYCKGEKPPVSKGGWKVRKNKKGITYGETAKIRKR